MSKITKQKEIKPHKSRIQNSINIRVTKQDSSSYFLPLIDSRASVFRSAIRRRSDVFTKAFQEQCSPEALHISITFILFKARNIRFKANSSYRERKNLKHPPPIT